MPYPALRSRLADACFEEIERVFAPVNSELPLGSLGDSYVRAGEFWATTAPEAPAIAIAI